jgi:hypothetical protein
MDIYWVQTRVDGRLFLDTELIWLQEGWGKLMILVKMEPRFLGLSKLKFTISVGQSVLVSDHHLEPANNFSFFSRELSSGICCYFNMRHPLWREDGSVIYWYKCYWALPALSLSASSPAEFETKSFSLIWELVPFLSPLNDLQEYGWSIITRLHTLFGLSEWNLSFIQIGLQNG